MTTATQPSISGISDPQDFAWQTVRKITAIATLPEVTSRIIATVEDSTSNAHKLHKIISYDPALVTRILKVVNSAFYGLPGQIGSIERAIVLLGLNAVKNIAVAASIGQLFRGVKLCDGYTAKDLWKHCISVAVAARELSKQLKMPIADEAFLAGLIHDVGILVQLQVWPAKVQQICTTVRDTNRDFCEVEREVNGVDHQMLGMALAELWKFPRSCQLVAGHHHDPASLADNNRMLVWIVYLADTICCQDKHGFNLTAINQQLKLPDQSDIAIDQTMIDEVRKNLPGLIATAEALF